MLILLILLGGQSLVQGVNYRKLYKEAVIRFKDPDFEAGKTKHLSSSASNLLKDNAHYQAFKKTAIAVEKQNRNPNREWTAGINEISLVTEEEFRSNYLGVNMTKEAYEDVERQPRKKIVMSKKLREELEDKEVDYRPYLPPIKSQGGCGSCWAFGAIAAMEYQVNKDRPVGGEMVALSEQQCIDCTWRGCNGGWTELCFKRAYYYFSHWVSAYNYIYQYTDDTKCRYEYHKNAMSGFKFTSPKPTYVGRNDEDAVLFAVANSRIGVLSAYIHVDDYWRMYKSGVYSSSDCNKAITHAVAIVGYGKLDGIPYWEVRNSWSVGWGDNGYIKMKRGVNGNYLNMCRLIQTAHYPHIEGSDDGQGSGTESEATKLECADFGEESEYRGVINITASGRTCKKWSLTREGRYRHHYDGLHQNFCRKPNFGEGTVWCYTTDPSMEKEACSIPNCSLLKWCEMSGQEFTNCMNDSAGYEELDSAKKDCYSNGKCDGITQLLNGTYVLMAGPLTPTKGYGLTLQKGPCKQLNPPEPGKYCKKEKVKLDAKIVSSTSLLEAKQVCRYLESCVGISGKEGSYNVYSSKMATLNNEVDTWFKDECPDVDLTKCGFGKQADYRGKINKTTSGRTCQRWDSQSPHSHTRTPENYPNSGLEENYCRNPDGKELIVQFISCSSYLSFLGRNIIIISFRSFA